MVTLSILKYLEQNGFGTIDKDLFWEKMGVGKVGLYITDLGGNISRTSRPSTTYQIFCRGESDVNGYKSLQKVADFLNSSYNVCSLPAVPPITNYGYSGVSFTPVNAISNDGVDMNGRVIYSITGTVYYGEKVYASPSPPNSSPITTEEGKVLITEANQILTM